MEKRQIGKSGLWVTVAGLGCNNLGGRLDGEGSLRVVAHALDRGITFFDTADSYGVDGSSERVIGEALESRRDKAVIATKFGWPLDDSGQRQGASARYIAEAVEASLRRLRTDWIDLWQLHRFDESTPLDETLRALDDLVRAGKVRAIGCSGLTPAQLLLADAVAKELGTAAFVSCQDHYNLLTREIETGVIPALQSLEMSLLPYAPLASGLLSGKYRRDAMPPDGRLTHSPKQAQRYLHGDIWDRLDRLEGFAAERGRSLLELAASWVASHPAVCSVIAGAMSIEQVDANIDSASWRMTAAERDEAARLLA